MESVTFVCSFLADSVNEKAYSISHYINPGRNQTWTALDASLFSSHNQHFSTNFRGIVLSLTFRKIKDDNHSDLQLKTSVKIEKILRS